MENPRIYGEVPFNIAVVHGGPGAGGEMAPVARELSQVSGVLEPIQTANSMEGQVAELQSILENYTASPITLIGYSWGAWLSYILTARNPELIHKLILVSSGPFEEYFVSQLQTTRFDRLSQTEREEFQTIARILGEATTPGKDNLLTRLGALAEKADSFDPLPIETNSEDAIGPKGDVFTGVWQEAAEMRRNGTLLELGTLIKCSVVAIHGDYDPHPAAGVYEPLSKVLNNFQFILLENCGHTPWRERQAKEKFYLELRRAIRSK